MARNRLCAKERIQALGLETTHYSTDYEDPLIWMPRSREIVVVGYLVHDTDCEDPISSCDGMGKFIVKGREDPYSMWGHLGRYTDGEPDLDQFIEIIDRLRGQPDDDPNTEQNLKLALQMWEEAHMQGKIGTKYARGVEEMHHSGYKEIRNSEDVPDAVWIPDQSLLEHIELFPEEKRIQEAYKCFNQALDEFNKWAEGDCYGITIDTFKRVAPNEYERDDDDSCWGFIGSDYALQELREAFKSHVKGHKHAT